MTVPLLKTVDAPSHLSFLNSPLSKRIMVEKGKTRRYFKIKVENRLEI